MKKVRYLPQIGGVMVSHRNMVSPQNGDTRGGPLPPPPPSDATVLLSMTLKMVIRDNFHKRSVLLLYQDSLVKLIFAKLCLNIYFVSYVA